MHAREQGSLNLDNVKTSARAQCAYGRPSDRMRIQTVVHCDHHKIERQRWTVVEHRKSSACSRADAHVSGAVRLILGPDASSPGPDNENRRLEDIFATKGVNRRTACMHPTRDPKLGNGRAPNTRTIVGRYSSPLSHLQCCISGLHIMAT